MSTNKNNRIVQSYLFFNGVCEEAVEFYRKTVGAEVTTMTRNKGCPEPGMCPPGAGDKILHVSFRIGETTVLASDGECGGKPVFQGVSLALTEPDKADTERVFTALSDGGQVTLPLTKTFFSPCFGMLKDRFGVSWMIQAAQ